MKYLFLSLMVYWLSTECLLAQSEKTSNSSNAFHRDSIPSQPEPLFVIDGLISDSLRFDVNGMASRNPLINPDEIETMNVLKNIDAVALYGDRAKYGAIIITTKKARANKDKRQRE